MYNDGFTNILSIDYSNVVIEQMKKKYINTPQLKCIILFELYN